MRQRRVQLRLWSLLLQPDPGMENKTRADPGVKDEKGWTALDYALKTDNIHIIEMLCAATKTVSENTLKIFAQSKIEISKQMEHSIQLWSMDKEIFRGDSSDDLRLRMRIGDLRLWNRAILRGDDSSDDSSINRTI